MLRANSSEKEGKIDCRGLSLAEIRRINPSGKRDYDKEVDEYILIFYFIIKIEYYA